RSLAARGGARRGRRPGRTTRRDRGRRPRPPPARAGRLRRHWSGCRRTRGGERRALRARSGGGPRRYAEMDQELAICLRAEDRRGNLARRLQLERDGRLGDLVDDAGVDGRVPNDTRTRLALARLELGLDEGDDVTAPRVERRRDRPEDQPQRDE